MASNPGDGNASSDDQLTDLDDEPDKEAIQAGMAAALAAADSANAPRLAVPAVGKVAGASSESELAAAL